LRREIELALAWPRRPSAPIGDESGAKACGTAAIVDRSAAGLLESAKPDRIAVGPQGNELMRLPFVAFCWLAAAVSGAAAQTPTVAEQTAIVTGITITKVGTYTAQTTSAPARPGQDTPTGTVGTDVNWHFVLDSPHVAGKAGTQFGIEFRLEGTPAGDGVTLHAAFTFPPQGIRNPNTGDMMHTAKVAFPNMKIGALCLIGYGFDNGWEIVPGVWTEQIWYQDRMLAERSFTVNKAE